MIRTFIQISGLILTLEAAFFLGKGNLGLSAQAIAEISSMKVGYNPDLVASLAQQRADTWVGVVLLLGAFFLQLWNTLWPMRWVDFNVHKGAALYAVVLCVVVGFGAFFLAKDVARRTTLDVMNILKGSTTPAEPQSKRTEPSSPEEPSGQ